MAKGRSLVDLRGRLSDLNEHAHVDDHFGLFYEFLFESKKALERKTFYWVRVFIKNDWEDIGDIAMNGAASTDC